MHQQRENHYGSIKSAERATFKKTKMDKPTTATKESILLKYHNVKAKEIFWDIQARLLSIDRPQ